MDDLEAYLAGYAASLTVSVEAGAPLGSASVALNVFVLADTVCLAEWAEEVLADLLADGPEAAGFRCKPTPTGAMYQQLARSTIPADPEGVVTFSTLLELRDAVVAAGLPCSAWCEDDPAPGIAESGSCSDSSLLAIFRTRGDQLSAISKYRTLSSIEIRSGEQPVPLMVGPNWIVIAPEAREVADRLGGGVYVNG